MTRYPDERTRTRPRLWLGAALALACTPACLPAATISVSSASVDAPFEEAEICVSLELRAGEEIAGTENELIWQSSCASIAQESCAPNPAHGKMLTDSLRPGDGGSTSYKALVLSFSDTNPIPAGELYCCRFAANLQSEGECCQISVVAPGASDPVGREVAVAAAAPGRLCLGFVNESPIPTPTSVATATPVPPQTPPTTVSPAATATLTGRATATSISARPTRTLPSQRAGDDDGCAVAPAAKPSWQIGAALLLGLWARRRDRYAGRG